MQSTSNHGPSVSGLPVSHFDTKPMFRAIVNSATWPAKTRVWACLMLHSVCLGQESAVFIERRKVRSLRQSDIAVELGMDTNNVHRCILDLEKDGFVMRRGVDGQFSRGRVELHCFANPVSPSKLRSVA